VPINKVLSYCWLPDEGCLFQTSVDGGGRLQNSPPSAYNCMFTVVKARALSLLLLLLKVTLKQQDYFTTPIIPPFYF